MWSQIGRPQVVQHRAKHYSDGGDATTWEVRKAADLLDLSGTLRGSRWDEDQIADIEMKCLLMPETLVVGLSGPS